MKNQHNIHLGSITFNTEKTIERPYMDDLERELEKCIAKFLKDNTFKFAKKKFRIKLYTVSKDYHISPFVVKKKDEKPTSR